MVCKVVWFARFRSDLTRAAARRHWHEVHGAIGRTVPGMDRYVQSHVTGWLPGLPGAPERREPVPTDGYSCGWWRDRAAYDAAMVSPQWGEMGADAPNVFQREFFWGHSAIVEEHIQRDGPRSPYKVVWVTRFRDGIDPAEARHHWVTRHGPLALEAPGIERYVQNHAVEAVGPVGGPVPALALDGFSECWFTDASACERALGSPAWARLREDGYDLFDYSMMWGLAVDERVMRDDL